MAHDRDGQLTEGEIRPDHLMKEQAALYESDVRRLMERSAEFVDVTCPACNTAGGRTTFKKYNLDYRQCPHCETVYVSPRPTPAILEEYYATSENYEYWNTHVFPASEDVRRCKLFRPRAARLVEICRRYAMLNGAMLEVGAGFGTFCEEVSRHGVFDRIIAVEPTPALAVSCREKGLEVIEAPIEHADVGVGDIRVVASFEVIEHLFSPRAFLMRCAKLLVEGGLLILTCPNVKGFDILQLGELSGTVDAEHLNYFHADSLSRLLEDCGFKVLEASTPGLLDAELVRNKVLAGEVDLAGQPFLRQVLIDEWDRVGGAFQKFLANNELSSHMRLVAQLR